MEGAKNQGSGRPDRHVQHLGEFADDLQKAASRRSPRGAKVYNKVAVLGVTWDNDTMGCLGYQERLFEVLRDVYNYQTEELVLRSKPAVNSTRPERDAQEQFEDALDAFRFKHDAEDALSIIYYSGHASSDYSTNNKLTLAGDLHPYSGGFRGLTLEWNKITERVERLREGRLLLVFDSCAAGAAGSYEGPELLAASSSWHATASDRPERNFTHVLTQHLRRLNGTPMFLVDLAEEMVRQAATPGFELDFHPVHFPSTRPEDIDSAVLEAVAPLPRSEAAMQARAEALSRAGRAGLKVAVSVALACPVANRDLVQLKEWLAKNVPQCAQLVNVEAHFEGSTCLIVSMPYRIWDALPAGKPAYNFVAFTGSGNLLLAPDASAERGVRLAMRSRQHGSR